MKVVTEVAEGEPNPVPSGSGVHRMVQSRMDRVGFGRDGRVQAPASMEGWAVGGASRGSPSLPSAAGGRAVVSGRDTVPLVGFGLRYGVEGGDVDVNGLGARSGFGNVVAQGYHNILVEHKGSDPGQTRGLGATGGERGKTCSGSGIPAKDF